MRRCVLCRFLSYAHLGVRFRYVCQFHTSATVLREFSSTGGCCHCVLISVVMSGKDLFTVDLYCTYFNTLVQCNMNSTLTFVFLTTFNTIFTLIIIATPAFNIIQKHILTYPLPLSRPINFALPIPLYPLLFPHHIPTLQDTFIFHFN